MADKQIKEYSENTSPAGADLVIIQQNSDDSYAKVQLSNLIPEDTITDTQLDYPRFWQEIGRNTLTSAGDSISVSSLPVRKYLKILFRAYDTGGTITAHTRFNSDGGANYVMRTTTNDTHSSDVSQTRFFPHHGTSSAPMFWTMEVMNIDTSEKLVLCDQVSRGSAGGAASLNQRTMWGKWSNTSDYITSVEVTNLGTGSFATGSELVVLGHD